MFFSFEKRNFSLLPWDLSSNIPLPLPMRQSFGSIRNITISGRVASGATTLSKKLAEKLSWKLINGGEMYREYARKNNLPLEQTTKSADSFHRELDEFIKDKLKSESHLVVESWLSGFDAQGISGIYKIFVACPNDSVRIDRIVNRDKMTISQAKEHLRVREEENVKKWEKLYNTKDFWNKDLYDVIIDTYANGPQETLSMALRAIGYTSK